MRERYYSQPELDERAERLRKLRFTKDGEPRPLDERVGHIEETHVAITDEQARVAQKLTNLESLVRGATVAGSEAKAAVETSHAAIIKHLKGQDTAIQGIRRLNLKEIAMLVGLVLTGIASVIAAVKH